MKNKKIRFLTIFPKCGNVHLIKDVGMIPYFLYSVCGYDSSLACYNSNFEYLTTEVNGLKIRKIRKIFRNETLDGAFFIWRNAKEIDVLQFYHGDKKSNILWQFLYKLRNKKGVTYIKLDANSQLLNRFNYNRKGFKGFLFRKYLQRCDVISAETKDAVEKISRVWKRKIEYIPNGFYKKSSLTKVGYEKKENIILTVGRLGSIPKNTKELLDGFAIFAKREKNFYLYLVGPIEESFKGEVDEFFENNPNLKDRVIFMGEIADRDKLNEIYSKSKIFVLTSKWENFALVLLEAISNGCYIVTSAVGAYKEVTDNGKYGTWYTSGESKELADKLFEVSLNEYELEKKCIEMQEFSYRTFYWPEIVKTLDKIIMKKRKYVIDKSGGYKE